MKKILGFISIISLLALLGAVPAYAQYYVPQGGGPAKQIFINKLVFNPNTRLFVDNLGINDHRFLASNEVIFQIRVQNSGQENLTNLKVLDSIPNFVDFVSGPGSFNTQTRTLEFKIDNLAVNETKTFEVRIRVRNSENLPQNQVSCVTNVATVTDSVSAQDSSTFCIESRILGVELPVTGKGGEVLPGVTELPVTGPAETTLILLGSLGLLGSALYLLKKYA